MDKQRLIWNLLDDDWRDLTKEVNDLPGARATILTGGSGTMHLVERGGRLRVPGWHTLAGDMTPIRVDAQRVTPCGASWEDVGGFWHRSSQVVAVWEGWPLDDDRSAIDDFGKRLRTYAEALEPGTHLPDPEGHPPEPCGALWCPALGKDSGNPFVAVGEDVIPMPEGISLHPTDAR